MGMPSENYYWNKLKHLASKFFPKASGLPAAAKSLAVGASLAVGITVAFTTILAIVLLISEKVSDLGSLVRAGVYLSLGSYGAILDFSNVGVAQTGLLVNQSGVGIHSLSIFLVVFTFAYQITKRAGKRKHGLKDSIEISPLHLALGFALASSAISFISQGNSSISSYASFESKPLGLTSFLTVFSLTYVSSYLGWLKSSPELSETNSIWLWLGKATRTFVVIYSGLIAIALLVLFVRNLIEPDFAISSHPVETATSLTPDQSLWIAMGVVLFGLNLLAQFFFLAMGLNVGLESQGAGALLSSLDPTLLEYSNLWTYTLLGPWAYIGVLVLVSVVALISGAAATDALAKKVSGVLRFQQAYLGAIFATAAVWLLTGIQATASTTAEESTYTSTLIWGASLISAMAFATAVSFLAWSGGGKSYRFVASAFPRLVQWRRQSGLLEQQSYDGRVFGIFVKSLVALACLIPLGASSINRVTAYTDGPVQVGEEVAKTLTSGSIAEVKKLLSVNSGSGTKWLAEAILKKAQPTEGYSSTIVVTNNLNEPWQPGNLDAKIEITFAKDDSSSIVSKIGTSSTLITSGLLNRVNYEAVPTAVKISFVTNPFLKENKKFAFKVNGTTIKAGTFFAIPGNYQVVAEGYKLIAPTNLSISTTKSRHEMKIGYEIKLPDGSQDVIAKATQSEADKCLKVSSSGNGDCITRKEITENAVIDEGKAPEKYFEFEDSNFVTKEIKCSNSDLKYTLLAADRASVTAKCSAEISQTRTFYDSQPKRVPKYETRSECVGRLLSGDGDPVSYYGYNSWYGEDVYEDIYGNLWLGSSTYYDDCYSTRDVRVQNGFETIQVRGKKISSVELSSSVSKSIKISVSLTSENKLKID
ncbi:MAG: hypothetical protein EBZ61_02235 [Micrococcales bacterium]|nr:hypothetical protein [Micrococcales bacterium]